MKLTESEIVKIGNALGARNERRKCFVMARLRCMSKDKVVAALKIYVQTGNDLYDIITLDEPVTEVDKLVQQIYETE